MKKNLHQLTSLLAFGLGFGLLTASAIAARADSGSIVYVTYNSNTQEDIYIMSADGSGKTQLTSMSGSETSPVMSPDGSEIAFVFNRNLDQQLFVMNSDGTQLRAISGTDARPQTPQFSPDGNQIIFESKQQIFKATRGKDNNFGNIERLTPQGTLNTRPSVSSVSGKIAFVSNRTGNSHIWVMNNDGSAQTQLTSGNSGYYSPRFFPDGKTIYFDSGPQIFRINADGTNQTLLPNTPFYYRYRFSPDGSKVVFYKSSGNELNIYTSNFDGSSEKQLTRSPLREYEAYWGQIKDAPIVRNVAAKYKPFAPVTINLGPLRWNGKTLVYSVVRAPRNATVKIEVNLATFTPENTFRSGDFTFSASNGGAASNVATATLTPLSRATLTPSPAQTNTVLHANFDGSASNASHLAYVWKKNGAVLVGETGAALDLVKAGNGDRGDKITVEITADAGLVDSASIAVGNASPFLNNSVPFSLKPVTEKENENRGTSIEEILAGAGPNRLSDADGDPLGIAIARTSGWRFAQCQYSLDGGITWLDDNQSGWLTLKADEKTRLRVVPNGEVPTRNKLLMRAWDGTEGKIGGYLDFYPRFGGGSCLSAEESTLTFPVTDVDDAPIITVGPSLTIDQRTAPLTFSVKVNDENDIQNLTLSATSSNQSLLPNANISVVAQGNQRPKIFRITVTPTKAQRGSGLLYFTAKNGETSSTASIDFTVIFTNAPPTLKAPSTFDGTEDVSLLLSGIEIADTDAGSGKMQFSWTTTSGSATLDGLSSPVEGTLAALNQRLKAGFIFQPAPNFFGTSSLALKVSDSDSTGADGVKVASKTIKISVAAVNDTPTFPAATYQGTENRALSASLSATDIDDKALTFKVTIPPRYGTLALASNGAFTYTPKLNFNGTDTFGASASDSVGLGARSVITLQIQPTNAPPLAAPDLLKGLEDVPLTINAATLLKNDLNGENSSETDPLTIVKVTPTSGFPGKLTFDVAKQTILFVPKLNWNGEAKFDYVVQDSAKALSKATVTLQIAPVNDAPIALVGRLEALPGLATEIEVKASDIEGDALTFALQTKPTNGGALLTKVGNKWMLRYTAKAGVTGSDSLTFVARDAKLASAPATVSIIIKANHTPQNVSFAPAKGTFMANQSTTFEQKVRDANGAAHLDAAALLFSNSSTSAEARNGAVLWFDAVGNTWTLGKDDGKTYFPATTLGQTLENSQVKVTLGAGDIKRGSDGTITLLWRITFKSGWSGVKTVWGRVEDLGGLALGFNRIGQISLGAPAASTSANNS